MAFKRRVGSSGTENIEFVDIHDADDYPIDSAKQLNKFMINYTGHPYASCSDSWEEAVNTIFDYVGISKKEVIIPATAIPFIPRTIIQKGGTPKFIDIDPITFNIDINKIEKSITEKTCAIFATHMFGNALDVSAISDISNKNNIHFIEDRFRSYHIDIPPDDSDSSDSIATLWAFSNSWAPMATGSGGAITSKNNFVVKNEIDLISASYFLRMLNDITSEFFVRRTAFMQYKNKLLENNNVILPTDNYRFFPYSYLVLAIDRNELFKFIRESGVNVLTYSRLSQMIEPISCLSKNHGSLINANIMSIRSLALPIGNGITSNEIDALCNLINDFYNKRGA